VKRGRALSGALLLLLLLGAASGCKHRCWYEWRDEPYIRKVYNRGEQRAMARMRSFWADDREIGARALGVIAREARAAGEEPRARRLAAELIALYQREDESGVRGTILALCLRDAGKGDAVVHAFLKSRLHSGEHPAAAAYTLASLRPEGAFEAIHDAYVKASDYELRYELLGALWLLGDARAVPVLAGALAEVEGSWPARVHHMKKAIYRRALAGRLQTLKIACAAGNRVK
jgi:hypothetical protein